MNLTELRQRYWRIPVVALLAAVLAFTASYLVYPTYESSTRLLVHGRDATFLTSTGQDLKAQPGVVDASLSQALLSTYAGIATSRSVAESVVTDLQLDKVPPSTSPYAAVAKAFAYLYRCGRAFVTSGFCAKVDPYEKAVLEVQEGTSAEPTGTNEGVSAGAQSSYVLEVRASGGNPKYAQAITNSVADQLVRMSNERFKRDADATVDGLQAQVDRAAKTVRKANAEVADYQTEHNISSADAKQTLSATTLETVRADLIKAKADLDDTRAQLASVEGSLAKIPENERSRQTIVTGRSTTEMDTRGSSSVYNELLTKLNTLKASEAGFVARVDQLQEQVDNAKPLSQNGPLAELALLQQDADLAAANLKTLTETLQKAQSNAAQGSVDLSRLDQASEPSYPAKPKRYIYLALGLLVGGLAGAALTARASRLDELDDAPTAVEDLDQTVVTPRYLDQDEELDLVLSGSGGVRGRGLDASGPDR